MWKAFKKLIDHKNVFSRKVTIKFTSFTLMLAVNKQNNARKNKLNRVEEKNKAKQRKIKGK